MNLTQTYPILGLLNSNQEKDYLTFTFPNGGSVTLNKQVRSGDTPYEISAYYGKNNDDVVSTYVIGSKITLNANQSIKFYCSTEIFSKVSQTYYQFAFDNTKDVYATGNIMSLVNFLPNFDPTNAQHKYIFKSLFSNCKTLKIAPKLPARILSQDCYCRMFENCTSLYSTPMLPATKIAHECYNYMFKGCTLLTQVSELPATTLAPYCYQYMFQNCSSLINPPIISATTLATYCCRSMFNNCISLINPPELPASSLAYGCYMRMFAFCNNLITTPLLSSIQLAESCYSQMFYYCTNLVTALELPAYNLEINCYNKMFNECTSLSSIKVYFSDWNSNTTEYWLNNVAVNGTFYGPSTLQQQHDASHIPVNWTSAVLKI